MSFTPTLSMAIFLKSGWFCMSFIFFICPCLLFFLHLLYLLQNNLCPCPIIKRCLVPWVYTKRCVPFLYSQFQFLFLKIINAFFEVHINCIFPFFFGCRKKAHGIRVGWDYLERYIKLSYCHVIFFGFEKRSAFLIMPFCEDFGFYSIFAFFGLYLFRRGLLLFRSLQPFLDHLV